MNVSMAKRTTVFLEDRDEQAIAQIKEQYGVKSDNAAIRFALRVVTSQPPGKGKAARQRRIKILPE